MKTCKKQNQHLKSGISVKLLSVLAATLFLAMTTFKTVGAFEPQLIKADVISCSCSPDSTMKKAETEPQFKGGNDELVKFLLKNIVYPEKAKKAGITGKVLIAFTVDKAGKVKNAKVKESVNKELDAEALRVVNSMPAWIPGKSDGKVVDCIMVVPIQFKLK